MGLNLNLQPISAIMGWKKGFKIQIPDSGMSGQTGRVEWASLWIQSDWNKASYQDSWRLGKNNFPVNGKLSSFCYFFSFYHHGFLWNLGFGERERFPIVMETQLLMSLLSTWPNDSSLPWQNQLMDILTTEMESKGLTVTLPKRQEALTARRFFLFTMRNTQEWRCVCECQ